MCDPEPRSKLDRIMELRHSLVIAPGMVEKLRQKCAKNRRKRIQPNRAIDFSDGFLMPARIRKTMRTIKAGNHIVGVDLERPLIALFAPDQFQSNQNRIVPNDVCASARFPSNSSALDTAALALGKQSFDGISLVIGKVM